MRRFALQVILVSLAATVLWWITAPFARQTTIAGAKLLHRVIGYPAPHLLAELDHYHYFAPLFPPLVGLVGASWWVSWRRRLAGLAITLVAFWYLVSLQIAIVYSPYLTLSAVRAYLMQTQITLNSVAVPVVFWLIIVRSLPADWSASSDRRRGETAAAGTRWAPTAGLAAALCAILTMPAAWAAAQTDADLSAARDTLARAVAVQNGPAAIDAIDSLLQQQGGRNSALRYLHLEMLRHSGAGPQELQRARNAALTDARRRRAYRTLIGP